MPLRQNCRRKTRFVDSGRDVSNSHGFTWRPEYKEEDNLMNCGLYLMTDSANLNYELPILLHIGGLPSQATRRINYPRVSSLTQSPVPGPKPVPSIGPVPVPVPSPGP